MKRTAIFVSLLVLFLALAFVSCDAMFSNNLFSGVTQKKITTDTITAMTPADIVALTSSTDSLAKLGADPGAKAAALGVLATAYDTPAKQDTAAGQAAAMAAADISIKTVPDAAQFASSAISLVSTLTSATDATSVASALTGVLPADIAGQLSSDPQPPAAFTDMITAFTSAYGAYQALSAGVDATGGYADPSVTSSDKMEIAVNAMISGLLSSIVPAPGVTVTDALWSALRDPNGASGYLSFGSVDAVTGTGGAVGGLVSAAGPGLTI